MSFCIFRLHVRQKEGNKILHPTDPTRDKLTPALICKSLTVISSSNEPVMFQITPLVDPQK
jgi:hypothetical protein